MLAWPHHAQNSDIVTLVKGLLGHKGTSELAMCVFILASVC